MSQRTERLNSLLQAELMQLFQREMGDPRLGFATVTRVSVAPDLAAARVWVSVLGSPEEQQASLAALDRASAWLRRRLGERLRLRHVPELQFRHDTSIQGGDRVLQLLQELHPAEEER